jgi:photosynthetic reaction center cytochrome c subunit
MNRSARLWKRIACASLAGVALGVLASGRAAAQTADPSKVAAQAANSSKAAAQTDDPSKAAAQAANSSKAAAQAADSSKAAAQSTRPAAAAPATAPTAAEKFKNIQVLKTIPADQLIPSMQFITASLGVDCEYCHVEHAFDKDDKKPKLTARKMITMMMAINADNFKGEREVTCYSCHRGAADPVGTPILSANSGAPSPVAPPPAPTSEVSATSAPPTAQAILDRYLAAAGGAGAFEKITTRVQRGYLSTKNGIEDPERKFPIKITSEAPDKRVSTTHMGSSDSVTAYNGKQGWLTTPGGVRPMNSTETQAASIDAQLYFPVRVSQLYQDFKVQPGEAIDGKQTVMLQASGKDVPPLQLYFDQATGLLARQIRYAETPLGRLPTQIDYADYKTFEGVTIPYRWTLTRPNGSFSIQIVDVKQNLPVDENLFLMPPPTPPGPPPAGGPPAH